MHHKFSRTESMDIYKINSPEEYQRVMETVETYLKKATQNGGFHTLNPAERTELQHLSLMAEAWEDQIPLMPIRQPQTIVEMIELKMYEQKLKQKDLASLLGIPASRLSEIMQNKRKINLDFAQRLYKTLKIDPAFILEKA
jgi:HTH-type transcriptional regulator / antitoxin HigA